MLITSSIETPTVYNNSKRHPNKARTQFSFIVSLFVSNVIFFMASTGVIQLTSTGIILKISRTFLLNLKILCGRTTSYLLNAETQSIPA